MVDDCRYATRRCTCLSKKIKRLFNLWRKTLVAEATKDVRFRSLINAGNPKVGRLLKAGGASELPRRCWPRTSMTSFSQEFDERDLSFVNETSTEMFNLLLNVTTGEAEFGSSQDWSRECWLGSV